jgi:hypothetical protein
MKIYISNGISKIRIPIVISWTCLLISAARVGVGNFLDPTQLELMLKAETPLTVWFVGGLTINLFLLVTAYLLRANNWILVGDNSIQFSLQDFKNRKAVSFKLDSLNEITFRGNSIYFNFDSNVITVDTDFPERVRKELSAILPNYVS